MTSTSSTGCDSLDYDIRILGPEDYDVIIGIWKRAGLPFRSRGRDSREEMTKQMSLDPEMFLGCYVGGELAGVVV
jgi:hypothetical protein